MYFTWVQWLSWMITIERVRAEAAPWLPPIVLRVIHYVNAREDVLAFLHAVPAHARGEALDALVTLLEASKNLWPVAYVFALEKMDVATVAKALPALRSISINEGTETAGICKRTPLPPTVDVDAHVMVPHQLSATFGNWVRNMTGLRSLSQAHWTDVFWSESLARVRSSRCSTLCGAMRRSIKTSLMVS